MDVETKEKLLEIEKRLELVQESVEKVRKYLLFLVWFGIVLFLLPLVGLILVLPQFMEIYSSVGI